MSGGGDINAGKVVDNMLDVERRRQAVEDVEKTIEMGLEDEYVEMGGDGDINAGEENQAEHGGEPQLKGQEEKDDIEEHCDEGGNGDEVNGKKRYT